MLLHRAGIFGFFGGLFAIGGWWVVHTWKALWRRGRSSRERLLYDEGVRGGWDSSKASSSFLSSRGWA